MHKIVSPYIPFPNIAWWAAVCDAGHICFDKAEHFEKMTYRNKYFISGANGGIQLSIPLQQGREQRTPMKEVKIDNRQRWQTQHWRTIVSVYKRTPFFEYYEPDLQQLFEQPFEYLTAFNSQTVDCLKRQIKCSIEEEVYDDYQKKYEGNIIDIRNHVKPGIEKTVLDTEPYYQIFSDRNGFLPNLSLLDLLFSEGPNTLSWIKQHSALTENWMNT